VRFVPASRNWDARGASPKRVAFEMNHGNSGRTDLRLTGTVANIEKAFHVTSGTIKTLLKTAPFFAVDRDPPSTFPSSFGHHRFG